nr:uncharacterized protein LOC112426500 isoform X2 [Macaca nemestrina]
MRDAEQLRLRLAPPLRGRPAPSKARSQGLRGSRARGPPPTLGRAPRSLCGLSQASRSLLPRARRRSTSAASPVTAPCGSSAVPRPRFGAPNPCRRGLWGPGPLAPAAPEAEELLQGGPNTY